MTRISFTVHYKAYSYYRTMNIDITNRTQNSKRSIFPLRRSFPVPAVLPCTSQQPYSADSKLCHEYIRMTYKIFYETLFRMDCFRILDANEAVCFPQQSFVFEMFILQRLWLYVLLNCCSSGITCMT